MGSHLLTAIIAIPALAAPLVLRLREEQLAHRAAVAAAALPLATALLVALQFEPSSTRIQFPELMHTDPSAGGVITPFLAVDGMAALLLPLSTLVTFAVLVAAPRAAMQQRQMAAVLLGSATTSTLQCATDLDSFVFAWLLSLAASYLAFDDEAHHEERRVRRAFTLYVVGGSLPLIIGAVLLHGFTQHTLNVTSLVYEGRGPDLTPFQTEILCSLFLLTIFARKGLFPLHSWLPLLVADGPIGVVVQLLGAHASLLLLVRVVVPLLPPGGGSALSILCTAGLFSAIYASLVAFAQRDLRSMTGYIAMAQSSLIFVGLASATDQSIAGALLTCVGFGVSIAGLLCVVRALRARIGTTDLALLGGLVGKAPVMTAMFLLFASTLCAIPGSIGFAAEDLLLHGVLDHHPVIAALLLIAAALNAITLYRAFCGAFLGRPRLRGRSQGPAPVRDLLVRERVAVFGLAAVLFIGGLAPSMLLSLTQNEVHTVMEHAVRARSLKD